MTENREIMVQPMELQTAPSEVLKAAETAAKALADVINRKPRKIVINNEQYLEYEDWQTVAHFYGLHAKTGDAVPVEIMGIQGAKASAVILDREGRVVGGAEAYCLRDEDKWKNKPWFQLASMAQTRAASKAFSNTLRWVVVLAGYKGTPAEEMQDEPEKPAAVPAEHWCKEHKVKFFKSGNMKGYAHKIAGTDQWCNEQKSAKSGDQDAWEGTAKDPPVGWKATPQPQEAASVQPEAVPGTPEDIAHPDEVTMLVGELMMKFNWKDKDTAQKYIEQHTGKSKDWTQADLQKVAKVAKL